MAAVVSPQDSWSHVSEIVRLVKTGEAPTRPEMVRATRLSRNTVTLRVQTAYDLGLIEPSGETRSLGGRAAEVWKFRGEAGHVLVGMIGTSNQFYVALADLDGALVERADHAWQIEEGPETSLQAMAVEMRRLLAAHQVERPWGIGIGMPAPINFQTGKNVDPVAPGRLVYRWPPDFDVRRWFIEEFSVPVWTDSVINLTALGASTEPSCPPDMIYVRIGTGLGAALLSGGRLHRGASWVAGELNHVTMTDDPQRLCPCGRIGCLETYASGWAMLGDGIRAAKESRSPFLAAIAKTRQLELDDINDGVLNGDSACVEIVIRTAEMLGRALATLITVFNPARVTIGGFPIAHNGLLQSVLRRTIHTHTLAASVAHLELTQGDIHKDSLAGAVELVTNSLLSPGSLAEWGPLGSPVGVDRLLRDRQFEDE